METNERLNEFMENIGAEDMSLLPIFGGMFKEIAEEEKVITPEIEKMKEIIDEMETRLRTATNKNDYFLIFKTLEDIQSAAADAKIKMIKALR